MLGAIIGDIIGSRFEACNIKSKDFKLFHRDCRFTDDSVMTAAVAKAIMETEKVVMPEHFGLNEKYREILLDMSVKYMQEAGRRYPGAGYGGMFISWIFSDRAKPYNSFGNGSAMRISAAGLAARTLYEARLLSGAITGVTHNHEEGLRGAEAVSVAVFMAKSGYLKEEIREMIEKKYYPLDFMIDDIREEYRFSALCSDTVPQAVKCFLESCSFEDAIRTAISIGGDSDTIAAITGSIAGAYYGIPDDIKDNALKYLDGYMLSIYEEWVRFTGNTGRRFDFLTKYIGRIEQEQEEELNEVFTEEFDQFTKTDLTKFSLQEKQIISEISKAADELNSVRLKDTGILQWLKKLRDIEIELNSPVELCFSIGGFGKFDFYHMIFMENRAVAFIRKNDSETNDVKRMTVNETREFLETLNKLNIQYYRPVYPRDPDFFICDGTQWYLFIQYEGMRDLIFEGDNNYPSNWDSLLKLFDIESDQDKESEDLIYLSVSFEGNESLYYYLTDDWSIEPGDMVDVPVGNENAVKKAVVMKVEVFDPVMVPYPVNRTKYIIRKHHKVDSKLYTLEGLLLCNADTPMAQVYVSAQINDGCLHIKGQDIGKGLMGIFGKDEYEYSYSLDRINTQKFLDLIDKDDLDRNFYRMFSGVQGCSKFREYCETNELAYSFHAF